MLARLAIALLAALALPGAAHAGLAAMQTRDVVPASSRAVRLATPEFDLVGVHWRGQGRVELRTRSLTGRWSARRPGSPRSTAGRGS